MNKRNSVIEIKIHIRVPFGLLPSNYLEKLLDWVYVKIDPTALKMVNKTESISPYSGLPIRL